MIATDTTFDGDHGRFETRVHGITGEVSWLIELHPAWKCSKSRGGIDAKREYGDKIFRERRLYVSSLPPDPELFVVVSRAHGAIEHWLPYVLDVVFRENAARIKSGNGPEHWAYFRKLGMRVERVDRGSKDRIKSRVKQMARSDDYLERLLFHSSFASETPAELLSS